MSDLTDPIGLQFRRAPAARADKLDTAERTFEVCWSTGADVRRRSYSGDFIERLSMDPKHIRLDRLNAGASVLDSHSGFSMANRLGSVVPGSARIEGGKGFCTIRLSGSDLAETLLRDLEAGHRIHVSPGYRTHTVEKTEPKDSLPILRAVDWEPYEISVVAIPADAGAHTRAMEVKMDPEVIEEIETTTPAPATTKQRGLPIAERRALARKLAVKFPVAAADMDELISETRGADEKAFRAAFIDLWGSTRQHIDTRHDMLRNGSDQSSLEYRADALYARLTGRAPEERARQYMGQTLAEHATGLLQERGFDTFGMSKQEIFLGRRGMGGMHTTSDFPLLLQNVGRRVLIDAYTAAQSPLKTKLSRATTLSDFRKSSRLKISDIDLLQKVNEHGEIKGTTRGEVAEGYKLESYGSIFALTFQALVNDDLGAFSDWNQTAGRMAAETENELLFSFFREGSGAGPVMGEDNKRLFHADHNNLAATGTALDVASLRAARLAMRQQKNLGGKTFINAVPKFLLVGPQRETEAEQVLTQLHAAEVDKANPFAGRLELLVEPRIEDTSWYLFADPASVPTLEYAHLTGYEGPQFATEEGFEILGTRFRVVLHFGAGPLDWRGAYRNGGN